MICQKFKTISNPLWHYMFQKCLEIEQIFTKGWGWQDWYGGIPTTVQQEVKVIKKEVFSKSISAVGCGLFLFISATQVCAQHISLVHDLVIAEGLDVCENRTPTVIYCNWPHSTFCSKVSDDYDQCAFAMLSSTCIFNVIINGTIWRWHRH